MKIKIFASVHVYLRVTWEIRVGSLVFPTVLTYARLEKSG